MIRPKHRRWIEKHGLDGKHARRDLVRSNQCGVERILRPVHDDRQSVTTKDSWKGSIAWIWAGGLAWAAPIVVISVMMITGRTSSRTVHLCYRAAMDNWARLVDVYRSEADRLAAPGATNPTQGLDFLYPPSFLILYAPFTWLPWNLGELLWRALCGFGMAWMLHRLMRRQPRPSDHLDFALLSLAVVPICLGALQMGQANAMLAVSMLATCLAIGADRPAIAGIWLGTSICVKPFMLAPAGLAVLMMPGIALPLVATVATLAATPFLTATPSFVIRQYALFMQQTLGPCMNVSEDRFADLNGLLRGLSLPMSGWLSIAVRGGAGLAMAAWMLRARSRLRPVDGALLWLAASASYLMLFNPMTEANSYCIASFPIAMCAWRWIDAGRPAAGWGFVAALIGMGVLSEVIRPLSKRLGSQFDLRFMPLVVLVFVIALILWYPPRVAGGAQDA